jgi:hypothetical protein
MEAIYSSETSVDTQRTTRRYIPEDYTLPINLRSDVTSETHFVLYLDINQMNWARVSGKANEYSTHQIIWEMAIQWLPLDLQAVLKGNFEACADTH